MSKIRSKYYAKNKILTFWTADIPGKKKNGSELLSIILEYEKAERELHNKFQMLTSNRMVKSFMLWEGHCMHELFIKKLKPRRQNFRFRAWDKKSTNWLQSQASPNIFKFNNGKEWWEYYLRPTTSLISGGSEPNSESSFSPVRVITCFSCSFPTYLTKETCYQIKNSNETGVKFNFHSHNIQHPYQTKGILFRCCGF